MNTVYVICGATAIGKTDIAIALAQQLQTSIISADSRQCYREMNIGTAKPTQDQLALAKHYFISQFSITQALTAADFETLALQYLEEIFIDHTTAIVCGGTGLYIKALCQGLDEMPPTDSQILQQIETDYELKGIAWLQNAVKTEDPDFYSIGEIQNPLRMIRALSFIRTTGKSILLYRTYTKKSRPFNIIKIGLDLPREQLYARINQRVTQMMQQGLLQEAQQLYQYRHLKNLQTVGYTELFDYIAGKYTLPQAIEKIKQNTRNYAKRQMTWFKKDAEIVWLRADDVDIVGEILGIKK